MNLTEEASSDSVSTCSIATGTKTLSPLSHKMVVGMLRSFPGRVEDVQGRQRSSNSVWRRTGEPNYAAMRADWAIAAPNSRPSCLSRVKEHEGSISTHSQVNSVKNTDGNSSSIRESGYGFS